MNTMIRKVVMATAVMVAAAATTVASAQTHIQVPFSFNVAGKTLPAGDYIVSKDMTRNVMVFTSQKTGAIFARILVPGQEGAIAGRVLLNFDKVNGTYRLSTVEMGSRESTNLDSLARKPKNELAKADKFPSHAGQGR